MVTPNVRGRRRSVATGANAALLPVLHGFADLLADEARFPRLAPRTDFRQALRQRLINEATLLAGNPVRAKKTPWRRRPRGGGFRLAAFSAGLSLAGGGIALAAHSFVAQPHVTSSLSIAAAAHHATPAAANPSAGSRAPSLAAGQHGAAGSAAGTAAPKPHAASGPSAAGAPLPQPAPNVPAPLAGVSPGGVGVAPPTTDPAAQGLLAADAQAALHPVNGPNLQQALQELLHPTFPSPEATPSPAPAPAPSAAVGAPEPQSSATGRHSATRPSRLR